MDGTYTILVRVPTRHRTEVGALGPHTFDPGWYAYTGSAFGPGGLSRVDRHREVAAGERDVCHWHVDYLLGLPDASVDDVVTTAGEDVECRVARAIEGERVPAFGCSDCDCDSHLVGPENREPLLASVQAAHDRAGQNPPSQ